MEGLETTHSGILGPGRLDRALAEAIPSLSRARIQALVDDNALLVAGRPVTDASSKKFEGQPFTLTVPAPLPDKAQAQEIDLDIVFEDEHLIVVNKPAGLVVHPAAGHSDGTLVNALLHHCRGKLSGIGGVQRPGIVHRIDRDTSGLLVVAKTDKAHEGSPGCLQRTTSNGAISQLSPATRPHPPVQSEPRSVVRPQTARKWRCYPKARGSMR